MRLTLLLAGLSAITTALQPISQSPPAQAAPQALPAVQPAATGDGTARERRPVPAQSPGTFLSDHDYPADAIAKREQGTVRIQLSIDRDGRVTGCSVMTSSGSTSLDLTSCQLMSQRARFHPARDAQGEPVASAYTTSIRWVLPTGEFSSAVEAAYQAWVDCALVESATHARRRLGIRDIIRLALRRCAKLESEVTRVLGTELAVIPARNSIRRAIAHQIGELRRQPAPSAPAAAPNR